MSGAARRRGERYLLDTHAVLWTVDGSLPAPTRALLLDAEAEVFVSVASLWEIALKARLGKLEADPAEIAARMLRPTSKARRLGIEDAHLAVLARLPRFADHRDPFDHLLIAQALAEGMVLVSADGHAARYPVRVLRP